ncbi:HAD-IA family hydrolase [Sporosarcina sp. YIM B06819]|uniref:HAD family hydrolase n=1 Tax=Sporosarcina sp. YIM B06819 TaxID=3081769 RepID=UPI00298BE93F|nr:HAD-IA family hydrolase [Sporosarcina sp. YIM B06819]
MKNSKKIKALIFDWGDTVMKDFQEFSGPMAEWPHVETIPGIEETLEVFHGKYLICLATNAGASDASLVRKALARVHIDYYFTEIFTSKELGYQKPQVEFFESILHKLNLSAKECVMIGNDYMKDIVAAKEVGLQTIYLSEDVGEYEYANVVIRSMDELEREIVLLTESQ